MALNAVGTTFALIVTLAWFGSSGCGSCRKKAAVEHPPDAGPGETEFESTAKTSSGQRSATAQGVGHVAPRPVDRMRRLPASYWNLELNDYVVIRAKTSKMGETDPTQSGPVRMEGFTMAVYDAGGRENVEIITKDLSELYRSLIEARILTFASPILMFRDVGGGSGRFRWSLGVPVMDEADIKPPLIRQRVPSMRVQVARGAAHKVMERYAPKDGKPDPTWSRFVANVIRKFDPSIKPSIVLFRFPEYDIREPNEEGLIEVILGEPLPADEPSPGSP